MITGAYGQTRYRKRDLQRRNTWPLGSWLPASPSSADCQDTFKGVFFPEGTQFRATYKGRTHVAEIKGGAWVGSDGTTRTSPSEAAVKITGKSWNGWRFWHCKRPDDTAWHLIDNLRDEDKKLAAL
jgi:hypothetical protein